MGRWKEQEPTVEPEHRPRGALLESEDRRGKAYSHVKAGESQVKALGDNDQIGSTVRDFRFRRVRSCRGKRTRDGRVGDAIAGSVLLV